MEKKIVELVYRFQKNRILSSIRKGLLMILPVLITGSFATMLNNLPINGYKDFITTFAGGILSTVFVFVAEATFGFISAFLVFSISYYYSYELNPHDDSLQMVAMVTSFACFAISFGAISGALTISSFGAVGVFAAMFCSITATWLFYKFTKLMSGRFRSYAAGADHQYKTAIQSILPFLACMLIFIAFNLLINWVFKVDNLNDLLAKLMSAMFKNLENGLGSGVLYVFLQSLLWFFGIHGGNMLEQVSQNVLVPADTDPSLIISKTFLDNFSVMGGAGATLCLLLALLIFSKNRNNRQLVRSAAPSAIFNINEILIFGLPVVLNPIMLIPFLLVPVISLVISYLSVTIGFMPQVVNTVYWTTPPIFSGYIATGSINGSITQIVTLIVGTAVYAPFVKLSERIQKSSEVGLMSDLTDDYRRCEQSGEAVSYLDRKDDFGIIAKSIVNQLREDLKVGTVNMYYQPLADTNNKIIGAEALLRWKYGDQFVFPPLLVALAKEDRSYDELTACILNTVIRDMKRMKIETGIDLQVSMNVSAEQLNDMMFIDGLVRKVKENNLGGSFGIEVTEDTELSNLLNVTANLETLNTNGVHASIDDFSMGNTSLKYLQSNDFTYVKLDGGLVKQITDSPRSKDIIKSIVSLGNKLGFEVVAEYVETEELRRQLMEMGCKYFQGYLYSPAVSPDNFIRYCLTR